MLRRQRATPTITVTPLRISSALTTAVTIVTTNLLILILAIVNPNEIPMPPESDYPVVQATAHFPLIIIVAVVPGLCSPPFCFSMWSHCSFYFSISWSFSVFQIRFFNRPALSAEGDHSAPGLCEQLARCGRRRVAGRG